MSEVRLQVKNLCKNFGITKAVQNVSFNVNKGEVHALIGENGSGKTTLMNMLSGIYHPDAGSILVGGKEVSINSPVDSRNLGIGMIHQHFKLVENLTSLENIILFFLFISYEKILICFIKNCHNNPKSYLFCIFAIKKIIFK